MKSKMKYYLNNTIIWTFIISSIILLITVSNIKAEDSIYVKSGNQVSNENFKLILMDNVTSDILIDDINIYFYTENNAYSINKTTGSINFKMAIKNIEDFKQTENFTFFKTSNVLYTVNKTTGEIVQKKNFNSYIDAIYSMFNAGILSGISGPQGPQGLPGINGSDGAQGPPGPQGIQGNGTALNLIAGRNINISTNGSNITVTGNATWTLSGITTDTIYSGYIGGNISCPPGTYCIPENTPPKLIFLNWTYLDFLEDVFWHGIEFNLTKINNNFSSLQSNILTLQTNISEFPKFRQMAFEINTNTTFLQKDLVLIPYDFYINNVTTQLNNNTGYFNFTIIRYSSYPTGNTTLKNINVSSYLTITNMNRTALNRHDSLEIIYNNFSKVNNSIILFELERR